MYRRIRARIVTCGYRSTLLCIVFLILLNTLGYTARLHRSHWHSIFHFEFPSFEHVHELSRRKTCHFE